MVEETLLVLIITGIIAIFTYCVKNVKTSDCWSKEHCLKCTMKKQMADDRDSRDSKESHSTDLRDSKESHSTDLKNSINESHI